MHWGNDPKEMLAPLAAALRNQNLLAEQSVMAGRDEMMAYRTLGELAYALTGSPVPPAPVAEFAAAMVTACYKHSVTFHEVAETLVKLAATTKQLEGGE